MWLFFFFFVDLNKRKRKISSSNITNAAIGFGLFHVFWTRWINNNLMLYCNHPRDSICALYKLGIACFAFSFFLILSSLLIFLFYTYGLGTTNFVVVVSTWFNKLFVSNYLFEKKKKFLCVAYQINHHVFDWCRLIEKLDGKTETDPQNERKEKKNGHNIFKSQQPKTNNNFQSGIDVEELQKKKKFFFLLFFWVHWLIVSTTLI